MQVIVNGVLTHYTDQGKGKILLCVHGWLHDHTSYTQLAGELEGEYRVIALDLPNFGASQITEDITTLESYGRFLAGFVEKLKIKDYVLVGHSMGGQLAIYAVAHNILTPEKLILIASAGVRNKRKLRRKVLQAMAVPGKYVVPNKLKVRFYNAIGSDYSPNLSPVHKSIIGHILKADIQTDASLITAPTLLIYGSDDRFTTVEMARALQHKIKGSRLEIVQGLSHRVHQKAAPETAKYIREFVQ